MATDYDCWHESAEVVNVSGVIEMFQKNVEKVTQLIIASIQIIATRNWDDVIDKLKVRKTFLSVHVCVNTVGLQTCHSFCSGINNMNLTEAAV